MTILFVLIGRAENGIRTRDPQLGKLMLYQLSYFRNSSANIDFFIYYCKSFSTKNYTVLVSRGRISNQSIFRTARKASCGTSTLPT